ncbi:MAG: serpin family protein [Gemmatimonadaceae bacterium]
MRRLTSMLVAGGSVLAAACGQPSSPDPAASITSLPRALAPAEQELIASSNQFAFGLLREVNTTWSGKNVFISPLSASMALGMTMNGAAGTTYAEMRSALGFGSRTLTEINGGYQSLVKLLRTLDPKVQFQLANAIWYDRTMASAFETTFLNDTKTYFDAEVAALDMRSPQAVSTINDWASRSTNGRIPKVIDALDNDIVMLLANAIWFKGSWREQFDKSKTTSEPFSAAAGRVNVPTMQRTGAVRLGTMAGARVIELPYGGDAFAMTILLPDEGTSADSFLASLTPTMWAGAVASLNETKAEIHLPKFKLTWDDSLNAPLKQLGMRQAFVPDGADFTRMSQTAGRHLFISFVRQNTFVDVNEEGTEAAAVTTVGVGVTSAPAQPPVVRIDRPFIFAIRERLSGSIVFMGKIANPGA